MGRKEPAVYGAVNYGQDGRPRVGDWIQTYTGKKFHLLDPHPEDFDIQDIAHALANICRFTGHVKRFYSVAEHSVRVSDYLLRLWDGRLFFREPRSYDAKQIAYDGLMHDAAEAYICDMSRPFKHLPEFKFYCDIEAMLEQHIANAFNCAMLPCVKEADEILLGTEARDLMSPCTDGWHFRYKHLPEKIRPWSPRKAERRFLDTYYRLNPFGIRKPSLFNLGPNFPWREA